jgi:hypothetical protein
MSEIRKKFAGAKLASLKETRKEAEKKSKTGNRWPGHHDIKEGLNMFRFAPPHSPEDPSYFPFRSTWLECDVPKKDGDDKIIEGEFERKNRRIFSAVIHSEVVEKDPIEMYIEKVYELASTITDKKEREKFLYPITGFRNNGKWTPGIRPSTNYVAYAWKDDELGRLELYPNIVKEMDKLNMDGSDEEAAEIDCFSDPDNGVSLIITYDPNAEKGKKYIVSKKNWDPTPYINKFGQEKGMEKWNIDRNKERVTDEQLEDFAKKESLRAIYVDVYTLKDFNLALNGLKIFDDKHEYGIFNDESFIIALKELESLLPEKSEDDKVKDGDDIDETFKKHDQKVNSSTVGKSSDNESPYSDWKPMDMRKLIKAYIIDNYGNEEEYISQIPKASDKSTLIKWCEIIGEEGELPFDDSAGEVSQESEITPPVIDDEVKENVSKGINDLRNRLRK